MKRLTAALLAAALACTALATAAFALNEDDYDNQNIFSVKEDNGTLSPGVDYYFDCEWQGGEMTDDFFEFYDVSVSITSDDPDELSRSTARRMIDVAEFVKVNGKYKFHLRPSAAVSYKDDATVALLVLAKDRSKASSNSSSRSWYDFTVDIGYGYYDKENPTIVTDSEYDVDNSEAILEFDEDLKSCRLNFEDGSYYTLRPSKSRKYNLTMSTDANAVVLTAHPTATFKFLSFYGRPSMASSSVLRVSAPLACTYLYEVGSDRRLTLVAQGNTSGHMGVSTNQLGSYIASSVPLAERLLLDGSSAAASSGTAGSGAAGSTAGVNQNQIVNYNPAPATTGQPVLVNPNTGAAA